MPLFASNVLGVAVYNSTTQSVSSGAWTSITYDTEVRDDSNFHNLSSNTSRLTAPISGWYSIHTVIEFAANHTGARGVRILLNGAGNGISRVFYDQAPQNSGSPDIFQVGIGALYYLNTNDYVETQVYQASGGSLNIDGSSLNQFAMIVRP